MLWSQPCLYVFDTDEQEQSFDFFRSVSVAELTALFPLDSDFWCSTVLSVAMLQPAIRYAVSALGALHRQYVEDFDALTPEDPNVHPLVRYGLSQYTKALKAFADLATSPVAIDRLFAAIACVLIILVSTLQGFQAACLRHLANALRLYQDLQTTVRATHGSIYDRHITALRSILLSLQSQARSQNCDQVPLKFISFADAHHTPTDSHDAVISFASANEARDYCTLITNDLQHLVPDFDAAAAMGPAEDMCHPLFLKLLAAEDALHRLQIETLDSDPESTLTNLILQLDYCSLNLYLRALPLLTANGEMAWDIFDAHFTKIVSLSRQILAHVQHHRSTPSLHTSRPTQSAATPISSSSSSPNKPPTTTSSTPPTKPVFTTVQGIVGPLFTTAMHCRVPSIRHEALRLLRAHPRREGLWDNATSARVAFEVIALEERLYREREVKKLGGGRGRGGGRDVREVPPLDPFRAEIPRDCRVVDLEVVYANPRTANMRLRTEAGWGEWGRKTFEAW